MLHIVHLIGTCRTGGVQKLILQLTQSAALRGMKHTIVCLISSEGELKEEFEKLGMRVIACPLMPPDGGGGFYRARKALRKIRMLFSWIDLAKFFKELQPSLVHSHIDYHLSHQILSCYLAGTRYLWTIHGEYKLSWLSRKALSVLARKCFKTVAVTADSNKAQESTAPFLFHLKHKNYLVPTGVDIQLIKASLHKRQVIRNALGVSEEKKVIGSVGRLVPDKGYDILIKAIAKGGDEFKQTITYIVGEGSEKQYLETLIRQHHLTERIRLLGLYKNIPELLSAFDIYVQPSRTEGFPLAVIEAMAAELPIVASNAGGLPEMLKDSTGLLAAVEDEDALGDAIYRFVTDSKIRSEYSQKSRRRSEEFSIERIGEMFLDIYGKHSKSFAEKEKLCAE